jgi:5'-methylthioadenosine/S-adenosylhomocysteine nucleosidase
MIKSLCFIVAMRAEARLIIDQLNLVEAPQFASGLPMRAFTGKHNNCTVSVAVNGKDVESGLDLIGTQAATLTTNLAIEFFKPDLIISAGTAGGFARKGANIGDVYLSYPRVVFHDRRINIPGWDKMGKGLFNVYDTREIATALNLKTGIVTTGNSLDMPPMDEEYIENLGGEIKEMEAAAVAWVASLHKVPMFCIKAITDLVDSAHPTHLQFDQNLSLAVSKLTESTINVISYLSKE